MQVIVNDLVVTYRRSGTGPLMVMLHGWADSSQTFNQLLPLLEPHFTIVTIDLAGFGGSQPPHKAWGLRDYALQLRDTLQKIAIMPNDVTVIVGHSNGGAVALTAVAHEYVRPKKMILLASSGIRSKGKFKKHLVTAVAKTGKLVTVVLPKKRRSALRQKLYHAAGSDYLVAEHLQETFVKIVSQDVLPMAEKVHIPTLLLYGELDTVTPVTHGQLLQNTIVGSELRVVQNADHFLHQNHAEQVASYMTKFTGTNA